MNRKNFITVCLLAGGCFVVWQSLNTWSVSRAVRRDAYPGASPSESQNMTSGQSGEEERAVLASALLTREMSPPSPVATTELVPRSSIARELDEVMASFLTEKPRVVELLGLVESLAARAVVDPGSLRVGR